VIAITTQKGRRMALFGLGGSGMATAAALVEGGANLVAFDDDPARVAEAQAKGIPTGDFRSTGLHHHAALVLAPGVPFTHPRPHWSVELAQAANVPVIGDVELFVRERNAIAPQIRFVAITGTNGKSTTSALIAHILHTAGHDVQLGGNIGTAILSLDPFEAQRIYVVECSSYQIDLAPSLNPSVGILLNLTPDHLDRHGKMENYAAIKERLVASSDVAIIGMDDSYSASIAAYLSAKRREVIRISTSGPLQQGVYLDGTHIVEADGRSRSSVANLEAIPALRGVHNGQNACAAWACCRKIGLSNEAIAAGLASFPGLAHRMEPVARIGNVIFINDSKATNADAAARALASFDRIYWIAGGLAKDGGLESLSRYFPHIAKAYLVGDAAPRFAALLGKEVQYELSQTIEIAVDRAAVDALADDSGEVVVLLSPACASFDQFSNFEQRGEHFRNAVLRLPHIQSLQEA
jgi:UDP-N-acetylmuramoylalanine--D-glutamate ligase